MHRIHAFAALMLFFIIPLSADEPDAPRTGSFGLMPFNYAADLADYRMDVSLSLATYDFARPFGTNGMLWNMPETLAFTMSQSRVMHSLVGGAVVTALTDSQWGFLFAYGALSLADLVDFYLPGGSGWLHEEWHRAVLANRGISAQDDMIFFPFFQETVSVSHVTDAELERLKTDYPADFVRLAEAGYEADISLAFALKQKAFFDRERFDLDRLQAFLGSFNAASYLMMCAFTDVDPQLAAFDAAEAGSIAVRDAVGFDFLTWVYDLFRPEEPYSARGAHPSALGVNRYIKRAQLTQAEMDYLALQGGLAAVNVVFGGFDLFLPDRIQLRLFDTDVDLAGSIRHYLTSHGFCIDAAALGRVWDLKLALSLRSYFNASGWFPGAALSLVEFPIRFGDYALFASADAAFWWQPAGQSFTTTEALFGGSGRVRIDVPIVGGAGLFIEADAKSAGWQAGSVELDAAYHVRGGVRLVM
jgi:hypothetical protein